MALYSLRAAARLCQRDRSVLYRAVKRGELPRDAQGHVDTEDLIRLGYMSRAQAEAAMLERPPPSLHARMLMYYDRHEVLLHRQEALLHRLEALIERLLDRLPPPTP